MSTITIQNPRIKDNFYLWEAFQGINNSRVYSDFRITDNYYLYLVILAGIGGSGMDIKGSIDCSGNPNYPAGAVGDVYRVSVAGKIGGGAGVSVSVGNLIICFVAGAAGNQATVGANWTIEQVGLQRFLEISGLDLLETIPNNRVTNVAFDWTNLIGNDFSRTITGDYIEQIGATETKNTDGNVSRTVNTNKFIETIAAASGNTVRTILGTVIETITGLYTRIGKTLLQEKVAGQEILDLKNADGTEFINFRGGTGVNRIDFRGAANAILSQMFNGSLIMGTTGSPVAILDLRDNANIENIADATGGAQLKNSSAWQISGKYWNGAASTRAAMKVLTVMVSTGPTYRLSITDAGNTERFSVDNTGTLLAMPFMPSYPDNATAVAAIGAGKLYYTDTAGEYIVKLTH